MNEQRRIIVFAPHPDDETWGCGGSIARRINEGYEVIIVVITDGRHAFSEMLGIFSDPSPEELKKIRNGEVIRAAEILGVPRENLLFLDFEDGKLAENESKAEKKVIDILKKFSPVEVYFPYIKDCHPDHRATNRIVRSSLRKLGLKVAIYEYSIERLHSRISPFIDKLLSLFRRNMVSVDISEFLHLKKKATKVFKSELSIISAKQERPLTKKISKYLKTKETFFVDKQ